MQTTRAASPSRQAEHIQQVQLKIVQIALPPSRFHLFEADRILVCATRRGLLHRLRSSLIDNNSLCATAAPNSAYSRSSLYITLAGIGSRARHFALAFPLDKEVRRKGGEDDDGENDG